LAVGIGQNNMLISYNWNSPANNWKADFFAEQMFCTLIRRIHRNGRIAEHCLRPGRRVFPKRMGEWAAILV
ncbi:unnamed protein product, partial [marine sediment metagenome]